MSNIKYNQEQELAISLRGKNLLVSAAAGTGKTAVLVERIIRMTVDTKNPIDLDRMLIVTFTNAAAEEMRERIRNALYKEIKINPDNNRLRKQLILMGQANISTIHTFCSEVIRSNYHLLDIDPGFNVCDENDANKFLLEATSFVLAEAYEEGLESFISLVDGYGRGKDDDRLTTLLMSFYKKIRSLPSYREWLVTNAKRFNCTGDDFGKTDWGQMILSFSASRINGYIEDINDLIQIIKDDEMFAGYLSTLVIDLEDLKKIYSFLNNKSWDECNNLIVPYKFERIGGYKKGASEQIKNIVKDTRSDYKKEIEKIKERLSGSSDQIFANLNQMSDMMDKLAELLLSLDTKYSEIKNINGVLDYSDLEHFALVCLNSDAGTMYRDKFDEVFVDEYQDSNEIQESIVELVSGRGSGVKNTFMVGDIKQSIYKFRQADPGIFIDKYNKFSEDADSNEVKIELFKNFRSRKPILDFANYVFSQIMSKEMGDINYNSKVSLRQGNEDAYPEGNNNGYPVEIKLVVGEDKEIFTKDINLNIKEAAVVGGEILNILESEMLITDKRTNKQRNVLFGDITILIRNANSVSADYVRQLKKMGIPVQSESDSDFFNEREIFVIRSFLEVLDNPRRDISLLSILRSSIFGFTDKELAFIKCGSRYESFYDSMINFKVNKALVGKIEVFLSIINRYRRDAVNRPMNSLIWSIIHETGFYNQFTKGENSTIRMQNLRRLFEIAGTYEKSQETGLFGFIRYLDNFNKSGVKAGVDTTMGAEGSVRLMSIHKSKGLEFPVVILAGCGKSFNKRESSENIIFDKTYGFGAEYINASEGYKFTTAVKKSIKIKKNVEGLAEEMRVLYVALTRAREKLVITGYIPNLEKAPDKWCLRGRRKGGRIDPGKVMLASGFLDWIMSTAVNHNNGKSIFDGRLYTCDNNDQDPVAFKISIIYPNEIFTLLNKKKVLKIRESSKIDLSYDEIKKRFNWEYPYMAESIYHKKISVTEIKKLRESQNGEKDIFGTSFITRPDFMGEKNRNDAAEQGTQLHNIIAAVDISRALEPGYIEELFRLVGSEKENIEPYSELIRGFFRSSLGIRMINSVKIEIEKPFLYPVPTRSLYPDNKLLYDSQHSTLIQGVIDCMFYESESIVIIDYKSDNVIVGNEKKHASKYKVQLDLYAEAVEKLTGIQVKEKYIYFLRTKAEVQLT
ncbi:MAG: helicase-exonuclease AddAB subunit AddA [Clostridiales bacterium]|nr:helicase-exonuclease AddAB subunit AddA [Clostridiales bacterium]